MKDKLHRFLLGPQGGLIALNLACALLGLVQGLYTAAILSPAQFGVIGVLIALSAIVANFWDFRLMDLASKLHYSFRDDPSKQTTSMATALLCNGGLAIAMALCSIPVCLFAASLMTDNPILLFWAIAQGGMIAGNFMLSALHAACRLTGNLKPYAALRLGSQIFMLVNMVFILHYLPSIEGYYTAGLMAQLINITASLLVLGMIWKHQFGLRFGHWRSILATFKDERRFVLSANVMAYSKMLSRGGDIVVFSLFASDHATGIYRLAKSFADNIHLLSSSLAQYYVPWFHDHLQKGDSAAVQSAIRWFILGAGVLTMLAIPASYVVLSLLNTYLLNGAYEGMPLATAILTLTFFFACGVHLWLWPVLIHDKNTHLFALWSTTGGIVQLAVIAAGAFWLAPTPALAALGVVCGGIVTYGPFKPWRYIGTQPHISDSQKAD